MHVDKGNKISAAAPSASTHRGDSITVIHVCDLPDPAARASYRHLRSPHHLLDGAVACTTAATVGEARLAPLSLAPDVGEARWASLSLALDRCHGGGGSWQSGEQTVGEGGGAVGG